MPTDGPSPIPRHLAAEARTADDLGMAAGILGLDGILLHVNERLGMVLQMSPHELAGTRLERRVIAEDRRRYRRLFKAIDTVTSVVTHLGLIQADGATAHAQVKFLRSRTKAAVFFTVFDLTSYRMAVQTSEGKRAELEVTLTAVNQELMLSLVRQHEEIAQRERAEMSLRAALADRETLLREVHHRVKNNLQILCDLLYLQAEGGANPEVENALRGAYARIYGMARLHEELHQSMEGGRIALAEYLERLASGFGQLVPEVRLRVQAETEGLTLDIDRAIHVGLIVNELITNSVKHAFVKRTGGGEHHSGRPRGRGAGGARSTGQWRRLAG